MTRIPTSRGLLLSHLLVTTVLSACGGGGGGKAPSSTPSPSGNGYTVSTTRVATQADMTELAPGVSEVNLTITNPMAVQFGFAGNFSNTGIAGVRLDYTSDTDAVLQIEYRAPNSLRPGVYHDTVSVGRCPTENCSLNEATNVTVIDVNYTVVAKPFPTVAFAASTVNVSALAGDTNSTPTFFLGATIDNPSAYSFGGTGVATNHGILSAAYESQGPGAGRLAINFKSPSTLAPGTYTDTIDLRLCLDDACVNPVEVSPNRVTVTYTITDTVPGPQGYTFRMSSAPAADAVWSRTQETLLVATAGSVIELNPLTDATGATIGATAAPQLLALSDDDSLLYVADANLDTIRRFTTAPLAPDIDIALGPDTYLANSDPLVAGAIQVAPGQPHVLAVQLTNPRTSPHVRATAVFDDGLKRANEFIPDWATCAGYPQWNEDATRIYTDCAELAADTGGVTLLSMLPDSAGRVHYAAGKLFSDWGDVVDIASNTQSELLLDGNPEIATVDAAAGRLYYVTTARGSNGAFQIETYDLATLERIGIGRLPRYVNQRSPARVVRWGDDGLAIITSSGMMFLVHGPLIAP